MSNSAPVVSDNNDSLLLAIRHLAASGSARTRKELSEQLGVAKSTISENVTKLLKMGILEETTDRVNSGAGRHAVVLSLSSGGPKTLALDVGVNSIDTALITSDGRIEQRHHLPHDRELAPSEVLQQACAPYQGATTQCANLGMSFAGPVDSQFTTLKAASSLPAWAGFDIDQWAREHLGIRGFAINDANATAWAEHFQLAKEQRGLQSSTTLTLKLASGMGMGVVIGGKLHTGADGSAGEISHVRLDPNWDQLCLCGRRGCIETIVSGAAILREVRQAHPQISSITQLVGQVRRGDVEILAILLDKAGIIGSCLAMLTNFLNPDRIILSGPLFALEAFTKQVHAAILEAAHPSVTVSLQVQVAQLGADAVLTGVGLIGAQRAVAAIR